MQHQKDLEYVLYIAASPERVWDALTNNAEVPRYWFGRTVHSDWRLGGGITINGPGGEVDVHGEVLEFDPPLALAYTFNIDGYSPSRVRLALTPFGDVTRLVLTHVDHSPEPLPPDAPEIQQRGWMIILNGLKTLVETGRSLTTDPGVFARVG